MSLQSKSREIIHRRLLRNPSQGGHTGLITGPPGTGKTSFLLFESKLFMKKYPNEIIFWRDSPNSVCQFNRIGNNYKIFVESGCSINFRNFSKGGPITIPYTSFTDFNEIINQDSGQGLCEPGHLNVLYFQNDYTWIDFMDHLRKTIGWQSLFIDECEDLFPLNPSRRLNEERNYRMEKNLMFSNSVKQFRKGLVNLNCCTQNHFEVDWRVKSKMNFIMYLRGSRVDTDSLINQNSVNQLRIGQVYVDWEHRQFGKLDFKGFEPREPLIEVSVPEYVEM
jgi:hypothetical protein